MGECFFFFFFWRDKKVGGGDGGAATLPAQFRRGCPSDVPLRFGTGQGERGDEGERERSRRVGGGGREARDAPPLLQPSPSVWLPIRSTSAAPLHTNSPL